MKTVLLFSILCIAYGANAQNWIHLASDPEGDGFNAKRQDAKDFYYAYDESTDSIWFKVELHNTLNSANWGLNILVDTDLNDATGERWPSTQNNFSFDVALTAWVKGTPGNYTGTIGVATAAQMMQGQFTGTYRNNIVMRIDSVANAYLVGLPRKHIDPDNVQFEVFASIGVSGEANDFVPNTGSLLIDQSMGIQATLQGPQLASFYPNPTFGDLLVSLSNEEPVSYRIYNAFGAELEHGILMGGRGKISLSLLVPGNYLISLETESQRERHCIQKL